MLLYEKVNAKLLRGNITHLPYKKESFDCVMSIATLEHIKELSLAISEMMRVLKKDGFLVLGFPIQNKLSDILLILTGSIKVYNKKLDDIHPNSHNDILAEIRSQFDSEIAVKNFPSFLPLNFSLYCSCMAKKV
jgi:ubiquinone/menaquinone biosynthesis C-methylase UbiE